MTERRCISCYDPLAEADATVLFADAQPVAWVHPACLEAYTSGDDEDAQAEASDETAGSIPTGPGM